MQLEIAQRRATEAAAAARRALPPGAALAHDYVFDHAVDGVVTQRTLSELFEPGKDTLAIYSYMFGPERETPCPMCTGLLDALNGVHEHVRQRMSLVVVAESSATRLAEFAKARGWSRLRVLSTAGNTYNDDYNGKGPESGNDTTMMNVFHKKDGVIRHFWASELSSGPSDPGQDNRGLDSINPTFTMFDFTPEGRERFYTKVSY